MGAGGYVSSLRVLEPQFHADLRVRVASAIVGSHSSVQIFYLAKETSIAVTMSASACASPRSPA